MLKVAITASNAELRNCQIKEDKLNLYNCMLIRKQRFKPHFKGRDAA